jgi:hypothetical protein
MRTFSVKLILPSLSVLALIFGTKLVKAATTSEQKDLSFSCLIYEDLSFYDFRALQNKAGDYSISDSAKNEIYTFNLCSYTLSSCPGSDATTIFAYKNSTDGTCTSLTDTTLHTSVQTDSVQIEFG